MNNNRRGMCQHIETFANKANNMVQRYYCWVKNSWYRGTGIEFREDIAALGALSFWVQCPRMGKRIISKISIQKIQELEDLCSWWSIGLREQSPFLICENRKRKPQLQDCSADCIKIELSKFCKNFVNNSSLTWGLEKQAGAELGQAQPLSPVEVS